MPCTLLWVSNFGQVHHIERFQFCSREQHAKNSHNTAWTAFHQEGLGCNLQHYNPLIDQRVAEEWSVPRDWQLKGQLVFGVPTGPPKTKTFQPLETRLSVHGMPPVNGEKTTRGC